MISAPILLLDDDLDDQHMFVSLMTDLFPQYPVRCFDQAQSALDYLQQTDEHPFLVVSELRLPGTNGIEFRQTIEQDESLRRKAIPFIFLTGWAEDRLVRQAYQLTIQGLFEKKPSRKEWVEQLTALITYWQNCIHPRIYDKQPGR